MQTRGQLPNQSYGQWRGDVQWGGDGSGMGQSSHGAGVLPQGFGSIGNMTQAWEPSILYLIGFVVFELVAFHVLGRVLK